MKKRSTRFIVYLLVLAIALGATLPGLMNEANRIAFIIVMSILLGIWLIMVIINEILIYRKTKNERNRS